MDPVSYRPFLSSAQYVPLPPAPPVPSAPPLESLTSDDDQINIFVIQRPQELSEQTRNWGLYCGYILIIIIVIIVALYGLTHLIKAKN
jgi:hypothetical protein